MPRKGIGIIVAKTGSETPSRVARAQFDAARDPRQRAVEAREAGREIVAGDDLGQGAADERGRRDAERVSGGGVGARDRRIGIEGQHRIRIVIEDRAEALFAFLELREHYVTLGDVAHRGVAGGDRTALVERPRDEVDRKGRAVGAHDGQLGVDGFALQDAREKLAASARSAG